MSDSFVARHDLPNPLDLRATYVLTVEDGRGSGEQQTYLLTGGQLLMEPRVPAGTFFDSVRASSDYESNTYEIDGGCLEDQDMDS